MRQILLDTETTGLEHKDGHRIIEIGCIELINRRLTGNDIHYYIDPERIIDAGAIAVHGITNEELEGKPKFADLADELVAYLQGADLVIHNAAFDIGFMDAEMQRINSSWAGFRSICTVSDTLLLAREKHPGQRNNLDALCKRYEIDNSGRELHGALLDAQLLADVYLAMTGGQTDLLLGDDAEDTTNTKSAGPSIQARAYQLTVQHPTPEELAAHAEYVQFLESKSDNGTLWTQIGNKH